MDLILDPWPIELCSKNEYTKSESNSQLVRLHIGGDLHCVQRTNIQNLKAIHNMISHNSVLDELCSKNEYTKSESNSQRAHRVLASRKDCVQRTNIQNLKAIHNPSCSFISWLRLCSKNEYTKSESNSQQDKITMSIFRPFQLLGFFNSINKRKISIDKSCNY